MANLYIFDISALNKNLNPQIGVMLEQIRAFENQIAVIVEDEGDWEQTTIAFLPDHIITRNDYRFTYLSTALAEIVRRASQDEDLFSIIFVSADSLHLAEALTVPNMHPLSVEEFIIAFNMYVGT